jgi:anthranilate/para-aminobenzoate synthase component I
MYFLRMGEMTVLGSSPEMLVRVTGRKLEYRPIAGTRKRGRDEADDLRLEAELRNDEKERAEHVMLVDLGRNDVGRVSDYGTVKVRNLMFVARDASGLRRGRHAAPGAHAGRRLRRLLSRGHAHRRAQSPRHGDH